jgi:hypothetical protein
MASHNDIYLVYDSKIGIWVLPLAAYANVFYKDLPEKTPTDKSNAIKIVINFLAFVKPLKTGTNYSPT